MLSKLMFALFISAMIGIGAGGLVLMVIVAGGVSVAFAPAVVVGALVFIITFVWAYRHFSGK